MWLWDTVGLKIPGMQWVSRKLGFFPWAHGCTIFPTDPSRSAVFKISYIGKKFPMALALSLLIYPCQKRMAYTLAWVSLFLPLASMFLPVSVPFIFCFREKAIQVGGLQFPSLLQPYSVLLCVYLCPPKVYKVGSWSTYGDGVKSLDLWEMIRSWEWSPIDWD